ncbi:hypothetical protein V8D89_005190 [Ganoderma adspersum]
MPEEIEGKLLRSLVVLTEMFDNNTVLYVDWQDIVSRFMMDSDRVDVPLKLLTDNSERSLDGPCPTPPPLGSIDDMVHPAARVLRASSSGTNNLLDLGPSGHPTCGDIRVMTYMRAFLNEVLRLPHPTCVLLLLPLPHRRTDGVRE